MNITDYTVWKNLVGANFNKMANNNNSSSSGGIGLFGLMFLIFMTLKLTGYINWSWWWVTAPLWGGFALVILIIVIGYVAIKILK